MSRISMLTSGFLVFVGLLMLSPWLSSAAASETVNVTVLGRTLSASAPESFCLLGGHASDRAVVDQLRVTFGPINHLVIAFADCQELGQFRAGRRTTFSRYGQVLVPTPQGAPFAALKGISRATFLNEISKSKIDTDRAISDAENRARSLGVSMTATSFQGIMHRDSSAVYSVVLTTMADAAGPRKLAGITAMTFLRELPVSVNMYSTYSTNAPIRELLIQQRAYLPSLIRQNP